METSGPGGDAAVRAPDLGEVVGGAGPFLTVYLPTPGDVENAAQRSELAWKSMRADLEDAGADRETLDAVEPLIPDAHQHGRCLAAVAAEGRLTHAEYGPEPPGDVARWASLPWLVPIVEWRQTSPPFVVVLTDRSGADLYAFRREGPDVHRDTGSDDDPVMRRSKPGGWSQRRFQERAENRWEQTAEEVAKATVRLVEQVRARVVMVGGEPRAVQLLREALPEEVLDLVEPVGGDRWEGRTIDDLREDYDRMARAAADQDVARLVEGWREEIGQADRATDGVPATIRALARSQADTLMVYDDPQDDRTAWFGLDPTQLSTDPHELRGVGVDSPTEGRLVDVLVRAALGTGAGVAVVPSEAGAADGVGSILRWSD